ncbi:glycine-rich domain-containing protein [Entomomonas asaccharolytica]|uniref:Uncharacterized protein n=1 Tax=Entomomonas asaccharolytica TaxID=2785331 RepID=A0A974RVX8_9GAMM|nr:hypothetical protein [Entomomonas asaccharolytica]QQP84502.1 hypothetical protein JHT90_08730 [Entomomonas asaccharolytica]
MESLVILGIVVIAVVFFVIVQKVNSKKASDKATQAEEISFQQRLILINNYVFTENVLNSFRKYYPQLDNVVVSQVIEQLKNYFIIVLTATHDNTLQKLPKPILGMPSRVVDDLWHVFILDSRIYMAFCKQCFGFYLHHNSADANVAYQRKQTINDQLYTTWVYAGQLENKGNLMMVDTFPMLFQIDDVLNIPQGFSYTLEEFLAKARLYRNTTNESAKGVGCSGCSGGSYTNKNNYQDNDSNNNTKYDDNISSDSSSSCSSCGGGGD